VGAAGLADDAVVDRAGEIISFIIRSSGTRAERMAGQLGGEDLVAVLEERHPVTADGRRLRVRLDSRPEGDVSRGKIGQGSMRGHLGARLES
jgi:hypothetical protein